MLNFTSLFTPFFPLGYYFLVYVLALLGWAIGICGVYVSPKKYQGRDVTEYIGGAMIASSILLFFASFFLLP